MQIVLKDFIKEFVVTANFSRTRLQEYNGIEVKGQVEGFDLSILSNPCSIEPVTPVEPSYKGINYDSTLTSGTYDEVKTGAKDLTDECAQSLVDNGLAEIV